MRGHAIAIDNWSHAAEDAHHLDLGRGVAGVFDGLAGHGTGDVASRLAALTLASLHGPVGEHFAPYAVETCRAALVAARKTQGANPRMTTTAVIACLHQGFVQLAWCGDSRAYELRGDGRLVRLTNDHDLIYEQVLGSRIGPARADHLRAAVDEARSASEAFHLGGPMAKKAFKRRNVMVSELSSGPVGYRRLAWDTASVLALTSDGVHTNLTASQMRALAAPHAGDPAGLAAALADGARQAALVGEGIGHPDDITCVTLAS